MPGRWIDLTRPIDADLPIYAEPGYCDPAFGARRWCGVADRGFEVWQLTLGSQTGTHIDAPGHFLDGGATLDALAPDDLVGRYLHVDAADLAAAPARHTGEKLLFLDASTGGTMPQAAVAGLIALPCRVWVMAGGLAVADRPPLHLHRMLAEAGRYLVEDLDPAAVPDVPRWGEVIALPLRLAGLTGSPARVLVRAA